MPGLFPRGAGNLEEVPQVHVARCIVEEGGNHAAPSSGSVLFGKALHIAAQADSGWDYLAPRDWCAVAMACQGAKQALYGKHEWLGMLGYKLIKQPEGFSPAILLGILMRDPAFSGAAWRTDLLTDRVQEKVHADVAKTHLVALPSPADSVAFWTDRLKGLLGLPKMPTGPQVEEARTTVGLLVDRSTGAGFTAMMEACLSVDKPNSTVGPIVLAAVIEIVPRNRLATAASANERVLEEPAKEMATGEGSEAKEFLHHELIASLLAKCGVTSIRTLVMLMGGVSFEDLKKDVKKLKKLKRVNLPRSVRRAIVKALAKSSWFGLLGVFRFEMFFKNLFKSIHIVEVLMDAKGNAQTSPDMAKVFLLQALLRGHSYPRTQAEYDALARAGKPWEKLVTAPLSRIAEDPLFTVDDEWTMDDFQQRLTGVKIPRPRSTGIDSMLSMHGNRQTTWHAIFDCGEITPTQILRNLVNLAMMDFPVERVQSQLLKSIGRIPMADLMKAYTVLKTTFLPSEVAALCDAALEKIFVASLPVAPGTASYASVVASGNALRGRVGGRSQRLGTRPGTAKVPRVHPEPPSKKKKVEGTGSVAAVAAVPGIKSDPRVQEVRVVRECGVADKKGQRHQIQRPRTVSTGFGQTSVDGYSAMVASALSKMMDLAASLPLTHAASENGDVGTMAAGKTTPPRTTQAAAEGVETPLEAEDGRSRESKPLPPAGDIVGVISYSEELRNNRVRSGVPPPLPKYTRVSMWRGESVCLEQLGAGGMEELLVGITWCESKGSLERVDLDLSVMVYDAEWKHLAVCSFTTPDLSIAGVQHSGDVTSAPYPDGARETCHVDFAALRAGFPGARYIVLSVISYTHQEWDALEDASVFVANPHARGSGPGGMAVIGAARLTGAAKYSIAGYLEFAPIAASADESPKTSVSVRDPSAPAAESVAKVDAVDVRVHFVFTDQEARFSEPGEILSPLGQTASGSRYSVGHMLASMQTSRTGAGAQTLANAAAFQAAVVCDKVCIVSQGRAEDGAAVPREGGGGGKKPALQSLDRGDGESRFAFFERIAAALDGSDPAVPSAGRKGGLPNYPAEALRPAGGGSGASHPVHTVFFGGELDDWLEVVRQHQGTRRANASGETSEGGGGAPGRGGSSLTLVNLHSAEKGWSRQEDGVVRVNGATAYEELGQAVREARGV